MWFEAIVFAVLVVFTVISSERFHAWSTRTAPTPAVYRVAAILGALYLASFAGGAIDLAATGKPGFLSLGFLLAGAAGAGILLDTLMRGRREAELRRLDAFDL